MSKFKSGTKAPTAGFSPGGGALKGLDLSELHKIHHLR